MSETNNVRRFPPRYRLVLVRESEASFTSYPRFTTSRDLFAAFREEFASYDRERFAIITVDTKNRMIGHHLISVGGLASSPVGPREVFKTALLDNAAALIFLHNHVSGDPAPSREDRLCTERLIKAAKLFDIRVLDHIVFGETEYFSFADAGVLADLQDTI